MNHFIRRYSSLFLILYLFFSLSISVSAQDSLYIAENYNKYEFSIPMRDGVKLFTSVYVPKDTSVDYPIILNRTPYDVAPYGPGKFAYPLGPSMIFAREGYIFVYQDVRGRFMSEGEFEDVRPNKLDPEQLDESRDTYDTIEWLIKNIPHNNGNVGMWGISYPGYYAAMGAIDAHPALKAVSPQAPIADWYIDDDFHRNGALWLPHVFNFYSVFGKKREGLTTTWGRGFDHGTPDGYKFFLSLGPLKNINEKYFKNEIKFWNDVVNHPDYDTFWQERNILPHLKGIRPAVLVVGGWFDAEDLYGALRVYEAIEKNNTGAVNKLVMGPWFHGGWERSSGESLGKISFGQKTSPFFLDSIELPFFNYFLKNKGTFNAAKATVFETGSNKWTHYDSWPPKNIVQKKLYFLSKGKLSFDTPLPAESAQFDQYISDPAKPVPFTSEITTKMTREYMVEDQRFVSTRPDVMVYATEVLDEDITFAGPMKADLFVSVSGSDADFVVKLIDVLPDDTPDKKENCSATKMGGYQMLVRGEIMRGRYRTGFSNPRALEPGKVENIKFDLQDINHTFKKGHRIMIHVQSSWFPLADRNPQKFINIYTADDKDFSSETHKIYHSESFPSGLIFNMLK